MNNVAKTSEECRQRFIRDSILTPQFISGLKKMGKYTRVQLSGRSLRCQVQMNER